jgi:radical SAM PhpK family P-methyltransferase
MMKKNIDCLLIGHNEMDFSQYEKSIRKMGIHSGAYRDLNKSFLIYNNRPYHTSQVYNLFCCNRELANGLLKPLGMNETFGAAVAYLGTYLHKNGFTFDYVNYFQDEKKELEEKLLNNRFLTAAVTTTLYVSLLPILEIVEFIRTYDPGIKIIVGGPFVSTKINTLDPMELDYLLKSIDANFYVNSSQGEAALVKIIDSLKNQSDVKGINNIYYKTADGYAATPHLRENNQLSGNSVNWNLFTEKIGEHAAVRTSISCPFSCSFCGFPLHAGKYQTTTVELIEKELDQLKKMNKARSIHFIDDTFNIPPGRFKKILGMMMGNRYPFKWHCYFRCQYSNAEIAGMMKESGCEGVFLGIESGNDQILDNMNKSVTTRQYLEGIELLKKYGIVTYGNFIIGFPGETDETVQDTIEFIEKSELDFYRVQLWYCEPITPIYREKDKYKIKGESFEWSHNTMDSRRACDWIDHIFLSINKSIWVPQYNFDFDSLCHLFHRRMSLEQVKQFLGSFNRGVKEKLAAPSQEEVSYEVIEQLKKAAGRSDLPDVEGNKTDISEAGFDF